MSKSFASSTLALSLLLAAAGAGAAPVINSSLRLVAASDTSGSWTGPKGPDFATGLFQDQVSHLVGQDRPGQTSPQLGQADQASNIDAAAGVFTGKGHASLGFSVLETDGVIVESDYLVTFTLTGDTNYSLLGVLNGSSDGGLAIGSFELSGPDPLLFEAVQGSRGLASSGLLHAGDYVLRVVAEISPTAPPSPGAFMGGSADFDFTFKLSDLPHQTPEPGTLALLAVAAAGLGLTRRTHPQASTR